MSRPLITAAVAESTVETKESAPVPIGEWARFSFHSIGISLAGALALLIPWMLAEPIIIAAHWFGVALATTVFFGVGVVMLGGIIPNKPGHWMRHPALLVLSQSLYLAAAFSLALYLPVSELGLQGVEVDHKLVSGSLIILALAVFALYESLQTHERLMEFVQCWPFWPATCWMPVVVRMIKVRPHEMRTRTATMDLMVAVALVWLFCPIWVVAAACFITAWSDPFARIVGKRWGKRKWPWGKKTILGSTACMVTATAVAALMLFAYTPLSGEQLFAVALFTGAITALVELIPQWPENPKPGQIVSPADNFVLVIGSAFALSLLA